MSAFDPSAPADGQVKAIADLLEKHEKDGRSWYKDPVIIGVAGVVMVGVVVYLILDARSEAQGAARMARANRTQLNQLNLTLEEMGHLNAADGNSIKFRKSA